MKMCYKSIEVSNYHHIAKHTDFSFLFLIQRAILLGLKEVGQLNEMQHRHAEAALLQQYRESVSIEQTCDD